MPVSCSFRPRDIRSANALQRQAVTDTLIDDAPQFLRKYDPRVVRGERRQLRKPFRDLAGAGKQLVGRHDLVDRAPFLGGLGIEFLPGEDEIAAAYGADHFLPQQMDSVAGHDAELEVRLVWKT